MSRSTVDELRAVRARIEDPAHWTQACFARAGSSDNAPVVRALDPMATCWCLAGAVCAELGVETEADTAVWRALTRVLDRWRWRAETENSDLALYAYNDAATHAEVLALIDDAIAHETGGAS